MAKLNETVLRALPLATAITFAFAGSAGAQGHALPQARPVIRSGDAVRIAVWRNEELSGEFDIAEDGSIRHPLYRSVQVAGLTGPEAEARVREFLSRYESSPQFVLEPLFRVAVGGEVRQPGLLSLPPETTVSEAVALAGGTTDRGRLDRVVLLRDGRKWPLDLTRPEAGVAGIPIRSGDQVLVGRRSTWFREYVAPVASILAAVAAALNYATR